MGNAGDRGFAPAAITEPRPGAPFALLDSMGELVSEQPPTFRILRSVLAAGEADITSNGIGFGLKCCGGFRCTLIRMYADLAKVITEARFHKSACRRVERSAR